MQEAINKPDTGSARKTLKILVDVLNKAADTALLAKNAAKQINTVLSKEGKTERQVPTIRKTEKLKRRCG